MTGFAASADIGLDPAWRVMNIDRLQAARSKVLETMGHSLGTEKDFAGHSINHRLPDEEPGSPFNDDEGLVIGVDMKPRTLSRDIIFIGEDGRWPAQHLSIHEAAPRRGRGQVKEF